MAQVCAPLAACRPPESRKWESVDLLVQPDGLCHASWARKAASCLPISLESGAGNLEWNQLRAPEREPWENAGASRCPASLAFQAPDADTRLCI